PEVYLAVLKCLLGSSESHAGHLEILAGLIAGCPLDQGFGEHGCAAGRWAEENTLALDVLERADAGVFISDELERSAREAEHAAQVLEQFWRFLDLRIHAGAGAHE